MSIAKPCNLADGRILADNNMCRVRIGGKFASWVQNDAGEKHQVALDFQNDPMRAALAAIECDEIVSRLFPEYAG